MTNVDLTASEWSDSETAIPWPVGKILSPNTTQPASTQNGAIANQKGAISHSTTGSATLDLFFKTLRNTPFDELEGMIAAAWAESKLDTLKIIFHLRDCRGGKGERQQFHRCLMWLVRTGRANQVTANIDNIPFFGTFKDLFALCDTPVEPQILEFLARQLAADIDAVNGSRTAGSVINNNTSGANNTDTGNTTNSGAHATISLAAKWAPSEGSHFDKKHRIVRKLCKIMHQLALPRTAPVTNSAEYRRNVLTPLRAHLNIVEKAMCARMWDTINFGAVPSVAMSNYKKAFARHQEERFQQYLEDVKAGRAKINSAMVFPHQLVGHYLNRAPYNEVVEQQWRAIVRDTRKRFCAAGCSALAVVDVSGSMSGQPMQVAIALGLLLAEIASYPFSGKVLTFSSSPELFNVVLEATLEQKVRAISGMNWNMSTDLIKVFDLLLDTARMYNVDQESMPKTLYIFSDMQFDIACTGNDKTNFEIIEQKYRQAGYARPAIVYWNLSGATVDFPVERDVPNTALVSGFSQSLLQLFIDAQDLSPYGVMRAAIDAPRYDKVKLDPTEAEYM